MKEKEVNAKRDGFKNLIKEEVEQRGKTPINTEDVTIEWKENRKYPCLEYPYSYNFDVSPETYLVNQENLANLLTAVALQKSKAEVVEKEKIKFVQFTGGSGGYYGSEEGTRTRDWKKSPFIRPGEEKHWIAINKECFNNHFDNGHPNLLLLSSANLSPLSMKKESELRDERGELDEYKINEILTGNVRKEANLDDLLAILAEIDGQSSLIEEKKVVKEEVNSKIEKERGEIKNENDSSPNANIFPCIQEIGVREDKKKHS